MGYIEQVKNKINESMQSSGGLVPFLGFLFVGIYIFLNPFPHPAAIRNISFYLAIFLLLTHLYRTKTWKELVNPFLIPVGLFVLWVFIGLFFALDVTRSVHDFRAFLINYIVLFCLLTVTFPNSARLRILSWLIILSVTASSLHEIYIWYFKADHPFGSRIAIVSQQLPVGPIGMMALYSLILSLALLTSPYETKARKILLASCSMVLLATVVFSQTRAVFLALPFSLGILFWGKRRSFAGFLLIGIALSGYGLLQLRSITDVNHYTDRLTINYISYLVIKEHPVKGIGYGIDTFGDPKFFDHKHYLEQVPKKILADGVVISSPHNMWIGVMIQTGLVGFCLFVAIYVKAIYMSFRLITASNNDEANMWGRVGGACLVAIGMYGFFNVVFIHYLIMLLCVSFFVISNSYKRNYIGQ